MSTLENTTQEWGAIGKKLDSKYEKCRNITEEIYKRINITFEIKKLETETQSDLSDNIDLIDSNELSNETDLFACDKTSLSSSTDAERPKLGCEKFININNNEEKKAVPVYKKPRKRFRKRIKKRLNKSARSESDLSSDEAIPLSRVDLDASKREDIDCSNGSLDSVMGVPKLAIITKDSKLKISGLSPKSNLNTVSKTEPNKTELKQNTEPIAVIKIDMRNSDNPKIVGKDASEKKSCSICSLSFRGDRGLRRHMTMSHIIQENNDTTKTEVKST